MTPTERRADLIRLLNTINELIREAELMASDGLLGEDDRRYAGVQLDFRRKSVERVELMLSELDG